MMLEGPPQSGKTSLLQLLHEAAVRSDLFSGIYYVDIAENNADLEQGLAQHETSWEELFAAGLPSMPKYPPILSTCSMVCCFLGDSRCCASCRCKQRQDESPPFGRSAAPLWEE